MQTGDRLRFRPGTSATLLVQIFYQSRVVAAVETVQKRLFVEIAKSQLQNRRPGKKSSVLHVYIDPTILHNEFDPFDRFEILTWITVNRNQVGKRRWLNRA